MVSAVYTPTEQTHSLTHLQVKHTFWHTYNISTLTETHTAQRHSHIYRPKHTYRHTYTTTRLTDTRTTCSL